MAVATCKPFKNGSHRIPSHFGRKLDGRQEEETSSLSLLLFSIKSFSPPSESDFILCPLSVRVCLWGAAATLLMLRAKKATGGVGRTQAPHLLFSLIFYDRRAAFETNSPNLRQDSLWSLISLFAAPELSFTAAPD